MPRLHPWQHRSATPKSVRWAIGLAVAVHVGLLAWIGSLERNAHGGLPDVMGKGASTAAIGGMPSAAKYTLHYFKVVDADSEDAPVVRAVVRDVFGENEEATRDDGSAILRSRTAAKLVIQVEKPGFAPLAEQYANLDNYTRHTIHLTHKPVIYEIVDTIFIQRCIYCHGREGKTPGVDLTSYAKAMASRFNGNAVVVPGKPEISRLVRVLRDSLRDDGTKSPHSRVTARLSDLELDWLTVWIREGAKAPPPSP